jgi:hypothetical protein
LLIAESRGKIAHDFRVFFMGHKGSIEARYTTNKRVLPTALINEMGEAFKRSVEFLDLEVSGEDEVEKRKEEMKAKLNSMTPEQLNAVQELLNNWNTGNESSSQKKQNSSSTEDGCLLVHCQTARSSSKKPVRHNSNGGPDGI